MVENGFQPLALNFANGIHPGGGFLNGARAQEEVLCRSSALYLTLEGDPMYEHHRKRGTQDSTDWVIYSPEVPVFRNDDGSVVDQTWLLSFITCAAPYAPVIGQPRAGDLLQKRINAFLRLPKHTVIAPWCWEPGDAGHSRMIQYEQQRILEMPWKMNSKECFLRLCLPLQIGHLTENF